MVGAENGREVMEVYSLLENEVMRLNGYLREFVDGSGT